VGKENKQKGGSFQNINFFEIFDAMDDDYLEEMALTDPKQLIRMCTFLTLDAQIKEERLTYSNKNTITD
jgi:hypothetical protein|tara:strand:- start:259 stop:465 length:207 start_codon:yes stop_codon:yes gene_type:complete